MEVDNSLLSGIGDVLGKMLAKLESMAPTPQPDGPSTIAPKMTVEELAAKQNAALADAVDHGLKQPAAISDLAASPSADALNLDLQTLDARLHTVEALLYHILPRSVDVAAVIKQHALNRAGSAVLDPKA